MMCRCGHAWHEGECLGAASAGVGCPCIVAQAPERSPIVKAGGLVSDAYCDWQRGRPCVFCARPPKSEAHHYPPKGRAGATNDLRSCPVCRHCHQRCHGQRVVFGGRLRGPIEEFEQEEAVRSTWQSFVEIAPWHVVEAVMADVKAWRERRRGEEIPW